MDKYQDLGHLTNRTNVERFFENVKIWKCESFVKIIYIFRPNYRRSYTKIATT
jgi:hypothetical protein